jgi:hypothetical protein
MLREAWHSARLAFLGITPASAVSAPANLSSVQAKIAAREHVFAEMLLRRVSIPESARAISQLHQRLSRSAVVDPI